VVPLLLSYIPGNGKALEAAAGKGHEILLEGEPPEGVGNFEVAHLSFRPLGVNKELPILFVKPGCDPMSLKNGIVEIPKDRFFIGRFHGVVMVGVQPFVIFLLVALLALEAARKRGGTLLCSSISRDAGLLEPEIVDRDRQNDHEGC